MRGKGRYHSLYTSKTSTRLQGNTGGVKESYQVSLRGHTDQDEVISHPDLFTFWPLLGGWMNGPPTGLTCNVFLGGLQLGHLLWVTLERHHQKNSKLNVYISQTNCKVKLLVMKLIFTGESIYSHIVSVLRSEGQFRTNSIPRKTNCLHWSTTSKTSHPRVGRRFFSIVIFVTGGIFL